MYTPALFTENRREVLHEIVRQHPLATLLSIHDGDIECTHLPMFLDPSGKSLRAHMARANEHWKILDQRQALAIFHGPEHYISPSWYPSKQEHGRVVPTWNYVVVHVRGRVTVHDDADFLLSNVTELTDHNERRLGTKWQVADAPQEFIQNQTQAIVGIELAIENIEGKFKLSQNRAPQDREAVIRQLEALGTDTSKAMSRIMREMMKAPI